MKDSFFIPYTLETLKRTLERKMPYAIIMLDTTGLDSEEFSGHVPTHVYVQQYVFDEKLKQYAPSEMKYEAFVACTDEALAEADRNKEKFDVFEENGFSREDYLKNAITVEQFQQDFNLFMKGIENNTTLLLANGSDRFAETYLSKIGCGAAITQMRREHRVLEQGDLTDDYYKVNPLGKDVKELNNTLKDLTKYVTGADDINLTRAQWRVESLNDFIVQLGRGTGILEGDWEAHWREREASIVRTMSEEGRAKYVNNSYAEKINSLTEQKTKDGRTVIESEKVMDRNSDCELNRLLNAFSDDKCKGIIFMQCATTGFDSSKSLPFKVGEPMQLSFMVCDKKDNTLCGTAARENVLKLNIQVSDEALSKAVQNISSNKPFNAFDNYLGMSKDEYIEKKDSFYSKDAANQKIIDFLSRFNLKDYLIVTNGKSENISLTGQALKQLGSHAIINAPFVDFSQIIKEYCYLSYNDSSYKQNVLLNPETYNKTFSLENLAKACEEESGVQKKVDTTSRKCLFMASNIKKIADQQIQISEEAKKEKEAKAQVAETNNTSSTPPVSVNTYPADEDYIQGDDYSENVSGTVYDDVDTDEHNKDTMSDEEIEKQILNSDSSISVKPPVRNILNMSREKSQLEDHPYDEKTSMLAKYYPEEQAVSNETEVTEETKPPVSSEKPASQMVGSKIDILLNAFEKQSKLVETLIAQVAEQQKCLVAYAEKYSALTAQTLALSSKQAEIIQELSTMEFGGAKKNLFSIEHNVKE